MYNDKRFMKLNLILGI